MNEDSTVSCYDKHAKAYDLYQSVVVPGYQEMLDLVAEACQQVPAERAEDHRSGLRNRAMPPWPSSREFLANIFLIDGSGRMVNVAAEKISRAYPEAILGCRVADLCRKRLGRGLGGTKGMTPSSPLWSWSTCPLIATKRR